MGKSGAIRTKALDAAQISAMETHENRADLVARKRVLRDIAPLVYSPYTADDPAIDTDLASILRRIEPRDADRHLSIGDACARHIEGARRNKSAKKICLHSIVQFPTDLQVTPEMERRMLAEAVTFVNETYGGDAVFHARLDRDEAGLHAVDVFHAPKYLKQTKRKSECWVSLTKFGKTLACARFGQKPKERKNDKTGEWEPVLDASGDPVLIWCDSSWYQGRALQDAFYEHLRDRMQLDWVIRGERKVSRDPDRLEVEAYKAEQERKKQRAAEQELNALEARLEPLRAAAEALDAYEAWKAAELEKLTLRDAEEEAARLMFEGKTKWVAAAILASYDETSGDDGEIVGGFTLEDMFAQADIPFPIGRASDFRAVTHALASAGVDRLWRLEILMSNDSNLKSEWEDTQEALQRIKRAWSQVGTWSRKLIDAASDAFGTLVRMTYDRLVDALMRDRKAEIEATPPPVGTAPLANMNESQRHAIRTAFSKEEHLHHDTR